MMKYQEELIFLTWIDKANNPIKKVEERWEEEI